MHFVDYGTYEEDCEHINRNILDGNVMNMSLIIMEENYGAIYDDDSSCHGYYNIKISSSPYTLQSDLRIYVQIISSGEMVWEGTYFFPININSHHYVLQKTKYINIIVSLRTIINDNVNVICHDSEDFFLPYLWYILQKCFSKVSPLNCPIEEHDNTMDGIIEEK